MQTSRNAGIGKKGKELWGITQDRIPSREKRRKKRHRPTLGGDKRQGAERTRRTFILPVPGKAKKRAGVMAPGDTVFHFSRDV